MTPTIGPVGDDLCVGDTVQLTSSGGAGTPQWLLASGPGNATFTAATAASTGVTVDTPGIYYFAVQYTEAQAIVRPCAGFPQAGEQLIGVCDPPNPSYVQWSLITPAPGPVTIYQSQQAQTYFYAPIAGIYNFELKCYYYENNIGVPAPIDLPIQPALANPNSLDNLILDCPMGVVAGNPINVVLHGCEASSSVVWATAGAATGGTSNPNSQAGLIVGTNNLDIGVQTIAVTCTDADGTVKTATCDVEIFAYIEPAVQDTCSTSVYSIELNNCGVICSSAQVPVLFFDCAAEDCEYAYITIRVDPEC